MCDSIVCKSFEEKCCLKSEQFKEKVNKKKLKHENAEKRRQVCKEQYLETCFIASANADASSRCSPEVSPFEGGKKLPNILG